MKKEFYTWKDIEGACLQIARQCQIDKFYPDYIVGLTRGGLIPATMLSHYLECPMHSLNVSLRDSEIGPESNLWMAEDAFGYSSEQKKILVVDDINDSGATINWIKKDWQAGCFPGGDRWSNTWHNTTRFAVITNNIASDAEVDYFAKAINKVENDTWIVYPWENFWYGSN
jgi:uncharacterized protein